MKNISLLTALYSDIHVSMLRILSLVFRLAMVEAEVGIEGMALFCPYSSLRICVVSFCHPFPHQGQILDQSVLDSKFCFCLFLAM